MGDFLSPGIRGHSFIEFSDILSGYPEASVVYLF